MAFTRETRRSVHVKQERQVIGVGRPRVEELLDGIPVLRSTDEGLVRYTRHKFQLYKEILSRDDETSIPVTTTSVSPVDRQSFQYGSATAGTGDVYMEFVGSVPATSSKGIAMHRSGSIIGHSTQATISTATGGDVTFEVRIDDANQAELENEFAAGDGTGEKTKYVVINKDIVLFEPGDLIQVVANETTTMAWDEVVGFFEVEFDV